MSRPEVHDAEIEADLTGVDDLATFFHEKLGQPGLAYGIVAYGTLVHIGGLGQRQLGGPPPDADTVFRIASMTKSFTAAAILMLRDEGKLRLDDPVDEYVPQLRDCFVTRDSPRLTIRHLLTMTSGLPTDDPWADRHQDLPEEDFSKLLADGVSLAWAPGTRFEYSNLGYAILGRVISAAAREHFSRFITDRILQPMGLTSTGFDPYAFDPSRVTRGYQRVDDGWRDVEIVASGAFSAMGGLLTSVRDIARWVISYLDSFPPRDLPSTTLDPLSRASRRELQQAAVAMPADHSLRSTSNALGTGSWCYGYGLFVQQDARLGPIVHHSGGYPGYGSHMRWHLGTGLGVVVLANSTYARMGRLGADILELLVRASNQRVTTSSSTARIAPTGPWPETLAARDAVNALLVEWDDGAIGDLFSSNVALDRSFAQRRADLARLRRSIGAFSADDDRPPEFDSPAHCRWWLKGEYGRTLVDIRLTPDRSRRVQSLTVVVPPEPGSPLMAAISAVVSMINLDDAQRAPGVASPLTNDRLRYLVRVATAWAGTCRVGTYLDGDGLSSSTLELLGADGAMKVALEINALGMIRRFDVLLDPAGDTSTCPAAQRPPRRGPDRALIRGQARQS